MWTQQKKARVGVDEWRDRGRRQKKSGIELVEIGDRTAAFGAALQQITGNKNIVAVFTCLSVSFLAGWLANWPL